MDNNSTEAILVVVEAEALVLGLGGNRGIGVLGVGDGDGVGIRFGVFGLQIFELAFVIRGNGASSGCHNFFLRHEL